MLRKLSVFAAMMEEQSKWHKEFDDIAVFKKTWLQRYEKMGNRLSDEWFDNAVTTRPTGQVAFPIIV